MLEQISWIAGIIAAVVAVAGLIVGLRWKISTANKQNAKVIGHHNSVNQSVEIVNNENNGR